MGPTQPRGLLMGPPTERIMEREMPVARAMPQRQEPRGFERFTRAANGGLLGFLGNAIYGPREEERMQMDAIREGLFARQRLSRILAGEEQATDQEMLGILSTVAPEQVAGGLLGQYFPNQQERAEPSEIRILRAAGIEPNSDEGRALLFRNRNDGGETMQRLQEMMLELQIRDRLREGETTEREQAESVASRASTVQRATGDVVRMAELNRNLRGTFLESGLPMPDGRRGAAGMVSAFRTAFGAEDPRTRQIIADYDEFTKLANDFVNRTAVELFNSGNITNQMLDQMTASNVSPNVAPEANDRILAGHIRTLLGVADRQNIELPNRAQLEGLRDELLGNGEGGRAAPEGDDMSAEERAELERLREWERQQGGRP